MVHQLRLYASTTGGVGSIPGRGIEMPSAFGDMANKIKKKKKIISQWTSLQSHSSFLFLKKKKNSINLEMFTA